MAAKGRDGSIWRFDARRRLGVDVDVRDRASSSSIRPAATAWRSAPASGRRAASSTRRMFGNGTWLFDVQAHPPTTAPAPNTVEDGQLLLLQRS